MSSDTPTLRDSLPRAEAISAAFSSDTQATVRNDSLPRETSSACEGPEIRPRLLNEMPKRPCTYSSTVLFAPGMMPLTAETTNLSSSETVSVSRTD